MNISDYLDKVRAKYDSGQATEHSYRGALEGLFQSIDPALDIINEPKKTDAGMPDFLFQRGDVPVGWCEAKDIDKDVIALKGYSIEQRKRYEKAFPNLIYTNGVDFEFIRDGEQVHFVSIADFLMGLQPKPEKFDELARQLQNFAAQQDVTIRSAQKLAELMAAKAAIIKDEIGIALGDDPELRSNLAGQFKGFKANLLPNLTSGEFADIYAETITYGMFAARLHDKTKDTFSRAEALELLPKSNPFLRELFGYIAGPALPDRLRYIVDDLAAVLRASDPHSLFKEFGKWTARNDPFIHFYEDFLKEYNPKKRKSRGVWYTPEPVVDFIVRAVDDVLKSEFGLSEGLADTSKVSVKWDTGNDDHKGNPIIEDREIHKVQILDPATGTGTFLAKAIQTISGRVKARAPGKWSGYVETELIPRIHGFELLMASYAMCHMKLDMMLRETSYVPSEKPPRISVWLTNALEQGEREVRDLFFAPLATEARGANDVKRQTPIMCIIGNPPYSGHSSNKGAWIENLMESYMVEPGGVERLKERNPKWVKKDEHKFIRLAENLIEKNGEGLIGFIASHGYLSDPTLRGMRWHLLKTFDKIYVLDLHGNANKKEVGLDGSPDGNVFDIKQGVAIVIAIKKTKTNLASKGVRQSSSGVSLGSVHHSELWGSRREKNEGLWQNSIASIKFEQLPLRAPQFPFVPRNYGVKDQYDKGFSANDLLPVNTTGIQSGREIDLISIDASALIDSLNSNFPTDRFSVVRYLHKPFDERSFAYFDDPSEFMDGERLPKSYRARQSVSRHMLSQNFALLYGRSNKSQQVDHFFVSGSISDVKCAERSTGSMFAPLYLYPDEQLDQTDAFAATGRAVNFDSKIYSAICKAANIVPSPPDGGENFRTLTGDKRPTEVKVFDYIYGVLHSPDYRETYKEFLKIDFPRIPYPKDPDVFAHISDKGEALRRLHLMEDSAISDTPYVFDGERDDVVVSGFPKWQAISPSSSEEGEGVVAMPKVSLAQRPASSADSPHPNPSPEGEGLETGRVYINPDQYFDAVPKLAWEFYIGGYQPAQKWLKDRKGRALSYDDIGHYQKIIKILTETDRIMKEINLPLD